MPARKRAGRRENVPCSGEIEAIARRIKTPGHWGALGRRESRPLHVRYCPSAADVVLNACTCEPPHDPCPVCRSEASPLEEQIAAIERQIERLGATLEVLRRRSAVQPAVVAAVAQPTIDIGRLRLTLGGPHGSHLDTVAGSPLIERIEPSRARPVAPLPDLRVTARAAVWDALAAGSRVVQIDGAPGAGVTTLLDALATSAADQGYTTALQLDGVCGPARDIAQRLALLVSSSPTPRFFSATELARIFAPRHLLLLDKAAVTADELTSLCLLLPGAHIVLAQRALATGAVRIELDGLRPQHALLIMADAYGRPIDSDNRRTALDLCLTTGLLPGPARLVATAAREMERSFISLRVQYETGDAVLRGFIAQLSPLEKRLLAALNVSGAPHSAAQLGAIIGESAVLPALERLASLTVVGRSPDGGYELPGYVAPYADALGAVAHSAPLVGRVIEILRSALESPRLDASPTDAPAGAAAARRLAAAERLVHAALHDGRWDDVLGLGPPLAKACAAQGSFGAWGRVLDAVEAAGKKVGGAGELTRVRHELGIRAVVLGEPERALRYLRPALAERGPHDAAGAAATAAVIALADYRLPAARAPSPDVPLPATAKLSPPARTVTARASSIGALRRGTALTPAALALLGLAFLASAMVAFFAIRPPRTAFAITQFTSDARAIARGSRAELCVAATANVVEIFPGAIRFSGPGRHCTALAPLRTTTFVAVASTLDGRQLRAALTVSVFDPAVSRRLTIAAFSVRPAHIAAGESTKLCYRVSGAHRLRLAPHVRDLIRLQTCETLRLIEPRRYIYRLTAFGDAGQTAVRQVTIDVAPRHVAPARVAVRRGRFVALAVYQFDATPAIVRHGQSTSLCAGVERSARGYVTHLGALQSGVTRCYRVLPQTTTTYRLYVRTPRSTAIRTMTVYVRPPGPAIR